MYKNEDFDRHHSPKARQSSGRAYAPIISLVGAIALGSLLLANRSAPKSIDLAEVLESYPTKTVIAKSGDTMSGLVYSSMQGIPWTLAKDRFYDDNGSVSDNIQAGKAYTIRVGTNASPRIIGR
jgi:hypothetical protein